MFKVKSVVLGLFLSFFSMFASAAGVDLSSLTAQVDFSTVLAAVLLVAGAILGVYIAIKASKIVINMVKGA